MEEFLARLSALDAWVNSRLKLVRGCRTPGEALRAENSALHAIRTALWANPDLIAEFIADNAFGLTADELAQVAAWKHAVVGQFYVERSLKAGAILVSTSGPMTVYSALGVSRPIEDVLYQHSGVGQARLITTTLVPFKGRITYDGFMVIAQVSFGPGVRDQYRDAYQRAKERGAIITTLPAGPPTLLPTSRRAGQGASVELVIQAVDALVAGNDLEKIAFAVLKKAALLALSARRGEVLEKNAKAVTRSLRRLEGRMERW